MGMDRKSKSKRNSPPKDEPWIWLTRGMIASAAYRSLGVNSLRVLNFLMIEHMAHAGTENGRLYAPYNQLVAFGVPKSEISAAICQLEEFGFIQIRKGLRLGGRSQASLYRLSWLPTADGQPANNRWSKFSQADAKNYRSEQRTLKTIKRQRKTARKGLVLIPGNKSAAGAEILKAVRQSEPGLVRKVEPVKVVAGSETRPDTGRQVGATSEF